MVGKIRQLHVFFVGVLIFGLGFILYFLFVNNDSASKIELENSYIIRGIDVSHHNTITDWNKIKGEDVSFIYIKVTEGADHQDRDYLTNYEQANNVGIATGNYHFYIFATSGLEQAKHFINTAKNQAGDLIPAIDVEHSPANPCSGDVEYIKKVVQELKVLEEELHKYYGASPLIYTNKDCYKRYIDGYFPDNPIWIVDLDAEPSSEIKNWRIWQFSHSGRVAGIRGKTDLNFYRYSAKEFPEMLLPY